MNEAITALVRRHDPDRFLTALFAPAAARDALLVLYAFNHELARAREVASLPPLALIRLQWWREVVEGVAKRHEIASPLSLMLEGCPALRDDLEAMIVTREQEAEGAPATVDDWRRSVLSGSGSLAVAAARLLGAKAPEAFRRFGAAYAVAGQVRVAGVLARQGHCLIPLDLLAEHDLTVEGAIAEPESRPVRDALSALVREGQAMLGQRQKVAPIAIAAGLPAALARRDFARWQWRPGNVVMQRGLGDRLSVFGAVVTGAL